MTLSKLLEQCVECRRGESTVELEMRLGHMSDTFQVGIPRWVFEQLERDLSEAPELDADSGYTEIVDYFYTLPKGRRVRTRVHYDSARMELFTEHIEKNLIQSFVVSASSEPGDTCRVEVSREVPVDSPPQSILINYVRVKQRRCFKDRRDNGDVWSFELNRTWSGSTRDAVEYNQHNCEPSYEVECELVDTTGNYMRNLSNAQVAESLRIKMLMLLGYDDLDTPLEISNVKNNQTGGLKRGRDQNLKRAVGIA